jgi:hypothetical protein
MKKKKILLIYYVLFNPGGVARVMTNLTNELVEQGHEVEILLLTSKTEAFYSLNKNIKIHTADMFSHWAWGICEFNVKYLKFIPKIQNINSYISHIGVYLLLKNWLLKNHQNYDTIISCWYKISSFLGTFKNIAAKTIAWEHTDYNVGGWLYDKKLRKFYKNLKGIVCINTPSVQYYKHFSKTSFIPNIIGEPFESKSFIPSESKENIISFVGRLDKGKNVGELLDIFEQSNLPKDWILQIIGDGVERNNLEKYVKDKGLDANVCFLGSKNIDEISKLLDKSKIFVSTSLKEGLPTVLVEAMFCSNALIAYDCNYGPSDIINENNGFLIPLGDKKIFREKLEYLIMNQDIYNNLNKSSYEESQKWKKGKILEKWTEIL